jgi:hypothetical protein
VRGLNEIRVENKLTAEVELNKPKVKPGDWPEDHGEAVKPITEEELQAEKRKDLFPRREKGFRQSTIR